MPSHRKSASTVDEMIENLDSTQRPIVEALRSIVKKAAPKASEGFKWSMPVFEHGGMLCYIAPMKDNVNFGFYESAPVLDDPDGLLEGTGKRMRHVKLTSTSAIQKSLFTKWVKQAIEFNEEQGKAKKPSTTKSRSVKSSRTKSSALRPSTTAPSATKPSALETSATRPNALKPSSTSLSALKSSTNKLSTLRSSTAKAPMSKKARK